MSTIHRLAGQGNPFELLAALEGGADPNDASGRDGRTPLMEAAKRNNALAARLLIRFGATLDVADADGRTPLLEASDLSMKRLLLDAGANPDFGRISGMTPMAFFASFRDRAMVEFFLAYGADPKERIRNGPTVREVLDDPDHRWSSDFRADTPERRRNHAEFILKHSDELRISPDRYVAEHRNILIWGFHTFEYDDPRLGGWATRVAELLGSPALQEEACRKYLEGEDLQKALRSLARPKWRAERERIREERDAAFEASYFQEGELSSSTAFANPPA